MVKADDQQAEILNINTFPLFGTRLIEASAGTGKTFTITGLFLRLLLGHGNQNASPIGPLRVEQILVVTFTEAATTELRSRIRERIHQARIAFSRGESDDPVIQSLLDSVSDRIYAARLLLNAEREMDSAAIYTIHGFCQRMLLQNAFESGSRFISEFVTDESALKSQVVADYWRKYFYPLNLELAAEVRRLWPQPDDLLQSIGRYLSGKSPMLSARPLEGSLKALHQQNLERIIEIKQAWLSVSGDVEQILNESDIKRQSYNKRYLPAWIDTLTQWAREETTSYKIPDALEKFGQQILMEKTKVGGLSPQHPVFSRIDDFLADDLSVKEPLMAHAIEVCRGTLQAVKQEKLLLSFDDLLVQLSSAIDLDVQGILTERIRLLYPVAMIDEFQDTDPLQYSIFSRIYLNDESSGLFMIGDPKQAIYAFRGADIFTYIKARNQVTAHYTLATNWRSTKEMVMATNALFEQAASPFLYDQDIPFLPVSASPKAGQNYWSLAGERQPAINYWWPDEVSELWSKADYHYCMAEATASQIQTLLESSLQGEALLIEGSDRQRIQPGNIAVLVRTGYEGKLIQKALNKQGIASVYLSNRDSVFLTGVAKDILLLMDAVLNIDDERKLKSCLASSLFSLNISWLDKLSEDEGLWEKTVAEFHFYARLWSERGILPMLRSVLLKRHISERWLNETGGERALTDYLHVSELLQQASSELESQTALVRWLTQSVSGAVQGGTNNEEQIQRLDSERNLVQIVTIHKSKGLEYDLVFLPFIMSYRLAGEARYYDPDSDQTILDLSAGKTSLNHADKERLAEDLRLLYVALTRAVFGCFIGVVPLKQGRSAKGASGAHLSALGYLLQDGTEGIADDLYEALQKQLHTGCAVAMSPPPSCHSERYCEPASDVEVLSASQLQNRVERSWKMTSYSGLVKSHHHRLDASFELPGFDIDSADDAELTSLVEENKTIFSFPKGARPGTFLHSVFENVDFSLSVTSPENEKILTDLIEGEQLDRHWLPVVQKLVMNVLSTPLDGKELILSYKTVHHRLHELEFLLPVELLHSAVINRTLKRYDSLSCQATELDFLSVKGMIKGFIDLVFEHKGRYYVLDWKSNYLGDSSGDYTPDKLEMAMIEHRYDFQYQIYTIALHRFLATRIPDYDYETHFGGVYYLFLRGMDGESSNGIFYTRPDLTFIDELDSVLHGLEISSRISGAGQMELDL
ncbi:exodeoxyribonuclease V subunit beta [Vibrio salinus]|uniref:exodeoxyribonuclease V subunit beta n=1 Tax=Vibrio salinus TaxID=2899784 RepID=UPI001E3D5A6E|nr:exodeoxyribonuclease V subunit beta [Vibrio salinus]MCE0494335.1 exodeoxyribonuclease V subunit beta [Vibrio salinus]